MSIYKGSLSRSQAVAKAGLKNVEAVEAMNCEPTSRCMPFGYEDVLEFSASYVYNDIENGRTVLTAYYYQDREDCDKVDDLSDLNWEIEGYEID